MYYNTRKLSVAYNFEFRRAYALRALATAQGHVFHKQPLLGRHSAPSSSRRQQVEASHSFARHSFRATSKFEFHV